MVDTILTAVGDIAALAAALFAFFALGKANATINEARAARRDAEQAAKDAAAERRAAASDRREAERDRMRRRVERVGELIEALFWAAVDDQHEERPVYVGVDDQGEFSVSERHSWMSYRNRLSQALVGLRERLPKCVALAEQAKDSAEAIGFVSAARAEVELDLQGLSDRG